MKKYYITRPDGSSIFALPYPEDFCYHCLCLLQNDGQRYKLLSSEELNISLSAVKLQLPTQKNLRRVALLGAEMYHSEQYNGVVIFNFS